MNCRPRIGWSSLLISRSLAQHTKKTDHYEQLEVGPKATQNEIKSAYFKLTMKYHPDKNSSEDAKLKFRNITEAYEVLGNYDKRRQYDRSVQIAHGRPMRKPQEYRPQDIKKEAYRARTAIYRHTAAPTGTSKMYDFDEWTKAHYGSAFRRAQIDKQEVRDKIELERIVNVNSKHAVPELVFLSFLFIVACCFILIGDMRSVDTPGKYNETNGKKIEKSS